MLTTKTGAEIIRQAYKWYFNQCGEANANNKSTDNVVYCGIPPNRVKISWDATKQNNTIKWCAAFISEVINDACKVLGITNIAPKTASADGWRDTGKKLFQVDKNPMPGCAFWKKGDKGNHVGIVIEVFDDYFLTIEGNTLPDDKSGPFKNGTVNAVKRLKSKIKSDSYSFIHCQYMHNDLSQVENPFYQYDNYDVEENSVIIPENYNDNEPSENVNTTVKTSSNVNPNSNISIKKKRKEFS